MHLRTRLLVAGLLTGLVAAATVPAYGGGPELSTYRVTITNLTAGQPFSPPVAATHLKAIRMFQVGRTASDELAAIAQDGNELPMAGLFASSTKVTQTVDVGRPLTPSGKQVGSFTDTASFEISAGPGDRFSIATMLICTNDGFLGLDAVKLPTKGMEEFFLAGYDAGREQNTERSEDIVDPCSLLGPALLPGDPNGNADSGLGLTTSPAEPIGLHPGISGGADLSVALHSWIDPVARVTIERLG